jgi:hypothetical protein
MSASPVDLALHHHFTLLIYPFVHDINTAQREERLHMLAPRWQPWWARLSAPERAEALESTGFFLPYIRGVLYPETLRLRDLPSRDGYRAWQARLDHDLVEGLAAFYRDTPDCAVLRLTCRESFRAALARFIVVPDRPSRHPPAQGRLDWIDALLFPAGVGFLILKVRLDSDHPTLERLLDLNRQLRHVHPPSLGWSLPALRFPSGAMLTMEEMMNFLTQGLVQEDALAATPTAFVEAPVPTTPRYTESECGRAFGERCQFVSYAYVTPSADEKAELPRGEFDSSEERMLYELGIAIRLGDSVKEPSIWVPHREQIERIHRENRWAQWRSWQALVLRESFVVLATEKLDFNGVGLPRNLERDYLPLYLFTLYQRFQLFRFACDLMSEVAVGDARLDATRALLQRFVGFRSQFWFNEVTRKPQGGELYRLLRQGLQIDELYDMVTSSVKEAQEFYEGVRARQVERMKNLLTFGTPLAAGYMFLAGWGQNWAVGVLLALLFALVLVVLFLRRSRHGAGLRSLLGVRRAPYVPRPGMRVIRADGPHELPHPERRAA